MPRKRVKVGVKQGGGPPPGYRWSVWILDNADAEARGFLSVPQFQHLAMQVRELARHEDATHSETLSIRKFSGEDFYELRDKGGVLGGMNVRVFFGVDKSSRSLVVLGAIKKQNDGPTPIGDKVTMRRRWRKYKNGDFGHPED